MTETDWLESAEPLAMVLQVRDTASERQLRLLALACAWHALGGQAEARWLNALRLAERYVDGMATEAEWKAHLFLRIRALNAPVLCPSLLGRS